MRVERCILCIPGFQAENERVFSTAGILPKQRRSRTSVGRSEKVPNIYANILDYSSLEIQRQLVNVEKTELDSLMD